MKLAIIADDLTGANDSGLQLAKLGLKTSVLIQMESSRVQGQDAIVVDTDSRSDSREEAFQKVKAASEFIRSHPVDIVFKKIDSTMRGNIGAEIDAVYDTFQPDFAVIAPAYPQNGRKIVNGLHYLNNRLLHETEVSVDPKTPVTESYLPKLLQGQTERPVELITYEELRSGDNSLIARLERLRQAKIPYLLFDSENESDLEKIVEVMHRSSYKIMWVGSAGLANYLPIPMQPKLNQDELSIAPSDRPVLLVVGSVTRKTRRQLELLLTEPNIEGIKLQSDLLVIGGTERRQEMNRVVGEAVVKLVQKKHLVLYSSGEPEDVRKAMEIGQSRGMNPAGVSNLISEILGEAVDRILEQVEVQGLVLTGGDTAKQVCTWLGTERFELMHEVEMGVPMGRLIGRKLFYAVTKAGGFGSEQVLIHSIEMLKGGKCV